MKRLSKVERDMRQDLELAGYADTTRSTYLASVRELIAFLGRSPTKVGRTQLRRWVAHLRKQALSAQRLRQHFAALQFLFSKTLGRPNETTFLSWPRDAARLPVVLSPEQVRTLLGGFTTPRMRALFVTMYAAGLRIAEACSLKTSDIDAARGVIHVRAGKGGRERLALLSPHLLMNLRSYWRHERPAAPWLFAGRTGPHVARGVARLAFKRVVQQLTFQAHVTPHVLRHAFATSSP